MNVILPDQASENPPAMLYLLHGLNGDHTTWMRRSSIERYAQKRNLAVFMPAANRSFYSDMAHGPKYWKFISEEFPQIINQLFKLDEKKHKTYVIGNSMGGYGSFKLGLNFPNRFEAVASLAGSLDLIKLANDFKDDPNLESDFDALFNSQIETIKNTSNDLIHKLKTYPTESKTIFLQFCGTEDYLYNANQSFKKCAEKVDLKIKYTEAPGAHNWDCWDKQIETILDTFNIEKFN